MTRPGELGRRELLKGLLALGAVACTGRVGGRSIEGTLVGTARERGHLLRDAARRRPATRESVGVAILGAGMAGLSAAWTLERAGLADWRVFELDDAAGGTARHGDGPVCPHPWGAHYTPLPDAGNRPLIALLDEVGALAGFDERGRPVGREEVLCREPVERHFHLGRWHEGLFPAFDAVEDDRRQLAVFEEEVRRWAAWRDEEGRPAFALPRARGSDAPAVRALDERSMASHLEGLGLDSPRLRWWVEYGCRDDFGSSLEQTSAWAGLHYHAARLDPTTGESPELLTWPEGNGRLAGHLAAMAGSRLQLGQLVTRIAPLEDGVEIDLLDALSGELRGLRAGHAVCALPRFVAGRVVEPWRASPPAFVAATEYGSWVVANLTLKGRPREEAFPLAWDNVLIDSDSLGYVVATHQLGRDHGPTVWTWYRPFPEDDCDAVRRRLESTPWQHWVDESVRDLERAHPDLPDLVERVDVCIWGHAMVRPRPGFCWSEELAAAGRPLGRLRFAHSDLSALPLVEEAQDWGVRAAASILAERGQVLPPWLS